MPALIQGQAAATRTSITGTAPGFVLDSWTVADGLPVNSITQIMQSRSGYLWLATFDGLVRFDGVRFTVFNVANSPGLPTNRIIGLREDPDGSLDLITEFHQLVRFKDDKFVVLDARPSADLSLSATMSARTVDGKAWSTNGQEIFLDGRLAFRTPESAGFSRRIKTITADHEGSLWFATVAGGLFQLKPAVFTMYGLRNEPGANNVYSVTAASSGGVWAGAWGNAILTHIDSSGRMTNFHRDAKPVFIPASLHEDARHRVIVGTVRCVMPSTSCTELSDRELTVHAIQEDNDGTLWIGTETGLFTLRGKYWQSYETVSGAPKGTVRAFARARDGSLWMATNGEGVIRFDGTTFTHVTTREGLPMNLVRALYVDRDGWLWIGTEGKGLARLDPRDWRIPGKKGRIANVRSTDGLFDDGIHAILEDNFGRFWMSTNRGIFWVRRDELNAFADGRATRVRSTGYTERHGLANREANGGTQPAATRTRDGRLWFATQDGIAVVDPATIGTKAIQANVAVEQVFAGDTTIAARPSGIEIHPGQRDLRIEFTAFSFLSPESIRFRYRLRPYDKTWVDADTRRSATYTRVPPGSYTFEVQASTGNGIWSARPASLAIHVTPRFVETLTFKLLVLLDIVLAAWVIVRYRIVRLRRIAEELQLRVDERTSQLREREALLADKNAQLEIQAGQLQELDKAKTRFFANVSHELRTPLTLTIGPLEDVRTQLAHSSSHAAVSRIDVALRNARRLFRLVNQILDVSRLEGGATKIRAQRGDLTEFVRGIASAFAGVAERKRIAFSVHAPVEAVEMWFDVDALEKIVANLLSNAFKFTPDAGVITTEITVAGENAMLVVSDSGPGIPAEHLPHIFDRFYQVDESNTRAQPGTGIGLSLARELAELHGGTITVESAEGHGAVFTLTLPLSGAQSGGNHVATASRTEERTNGVVDAEIAAVPHDTIAPSASRTGTGDVTTIMVVDDNADLRTYVRSRFEGRYRIVEASDGADAIRLARNVIPDLIISDVMMPGTDGHAVVAALRENPETDFIPVILLTAQATQDDRIGGLSRGADDYIVKPFDMRELEVRVDNIIASRRLLRERFSGANVDIKAIDDTASAADRTFVDRLKAAVEDGLSKPDFGVSELAKAVFQDRSHLFRRTKELLGETPSDLLRRVRLERASLLLLESEGSVAEVAYACGFNSVSHFCRAFRVAYDATPSEYRARNIVPTTLQPQG
jgi:signal transduction histidine kinase/DNA-binding response OmpR family regulator/ligand-binding sensor domain-containing protein